MNTIIDLIINLSEHLCITDKKILEKLNNKEYNDQTNLLNKLQTALNNIDYIKDIVSTKTYPTKQELREIAENIAGKPKHIEEEIKRGVDEGIKLYREETDRIITKQNQDIKVILESISELKRVTIGYD